MTTAWRSTGVVGGCRAWWLSLSLCLVVSTAEMAAQQVDSKAAQVGRQPTRSIDDQAVRTAHNDRIFAPFLEVRQQSGEFERWGSEITLVSPMVVMFRWRERIAGRSTSGKWFLTDRAADGSSNLVASGGAGPAPAEGRATVFTIDFSEHLASQPPGRPMTYYVSLQPVAANGQGGAQSTPIVVRYQSPGQRTDFTRRGLSEPITPLLESIRAKYNLPALAAAIVTPTTIQVMGATGIRKQGWPSRVTDQDRWHLGSNTKAMTATLVAVLVQKGLVGWYTTLGEIFPELVDRVDERYASARIIDILRHRAGIPGGGGGIAIMTQTPPDNPYVQRADLTKTEQRYAMIRAVLQSTPPLDLSLPFEKRYTNLGYNVVAAMLERATGRAWEDLMREELFQPLGMSSAGFGPPGAAMKDEGGAAFTPSEPDQPRGHSDEGGPRRAVYPGLPLAVAPSGGVHTSLPDYAKFIRLHMTGQEGALKLNTSSMMQLHTPVDGYGGGWGVSPDRNVLSHDGTIRTWYAKTVVHLDQGFAILIMTNLGAPFEPTQAAVGEAYEKLRDYYLN